MNLSPTPLTGLPAYNPPGVPKPNPIGGQPPIARPAPPISPTPVPAIAGRPPLPAPTGGLNGAPPVAGAPQFMASGPANPALKPPTGIPADARGGQVPLGLSPATSSIPAPTTGSALISLAAGAGTPYAGLATNTPGSSTDYTNKTITPGAGVDRLALAKSNFENFKTATDPEYAATLREAGQSGAASGQVGSGMLRGRLGDIGVTRARDLQTAQTGFLNDATSGSIEDQYKNIGIAQQQQGFQQGQQQTAFDQQQRTQALEEALKSGDFQRYYQLLQAGYSGNPSDAQLALAGNYGQQAGAAGAAAGGLAAGATRSPVLGLA